MPFSQAVGWISNRGANQTTDPDSRARLLFGQHVEFLISELYYVPGAILKFLRTPVACAQLTTSGEQSRIGWAQAHR